MVIPPALPARMHDVSHPESGVTPRRDALEADGGAPVVAPAGRPAAGEYLAPRPYEDGWCCHGAPTRAGSVADGLRSAESDSRSTPAAAYRAAAHTAPSPADSG